MENNEFQEIEKKLNILKSVAPDEKWRGQLRSRLLERSDTYSLFPIWKLAFGSVLLVLFLFSGTLVLAQKSVPGESLYPFKRVFEEIVLRVTPKERQFEFRQTLTNKRIEELKVVLDREAEESESAMAQVQSSVIQIHSHVTQVKQELETKPASSNQTAIKEHLKEVVATIKENEEQLSQIEPKLTVEQQQKLQQIRDELNSIQIEAESAVQDPGEDKTEGILDFPKDLNQKLPTSP